jgi:ABC-type oligopeptide transport system substrate-binding subunit
MGWYEVPEFDALIEKAESAATFEERLQYFAEAEAYLVDGGYVIPFISSLRGYYMTNSVPYTCPLTLYGNSKFKGALVMDEPLTMEEYTILTEAYDIARAEALAK